MTARRLACLLILLATLPIAAAGCGRRGPLEDPGAPRVSGGAARASAGGSAGLSSGIGSGRQSTEPAALATRTIADPSPTSPQDNLLDTSSPGAQVAPEGAGAEKPKRRFLLDPLL